MKKPFNIISIVIAILSIYSNLLCKDFNIIHPKNKPIELIKNSSIIINVDKKRISTIYSSDPNILDTKLPNANSNNIIVFGANYGLATLFIIDDKGEPLFQSNFLVKEPIKKTKFVCGVHSGAKGIKHDCKGMFEAENVLPKR